jgi:hypothetical protein
MENDKSRVYGRKFILTEKGNILPMQGFTDNNIAMQKLDVRPHTCISNYMSKNLTLAKVQK